MAKFSQKIMGKEVGQAEKYAQPHGVLVGKKAMTDPNTVSANDSSPSTGAKRVSAGNPARDDVKTSGLETRGNGAATKGRMARGPMA